MKNRLELTNPVEIDKRRAMDPEKLTSVEPSLKRLKRLANQVGFPGRMHPHIVVGSFDPINFFHAKKNNTPRGPDHQPCKPVFFRLQIFKQSREALVQQTLPSTPDFLFGSLNRSLKPLPVK